MQQSQTRARRRQFPQTAPTAQTAQIAQMAQIAIVVVVALLTAVASTALAAPPPPPPHNAVHSHHAGRRVLQQLQNEHAPSTLSSHNDDRNSVRALLADAEQPLLQPPASRRRHNNGVATHKPQSADGDGAADQAHATGGRRGGPSDHESSPPAAESLFTASNCKVVGECEECARFEAVTVLSPPRFAEGVFRCTQTCPTHLALGVVDRGSNLTVFRGGTSNSWSARLRIILRRPFTKVVRDPWCQNVERFTSSLPSTFCLAWQRQ
ncbi:hypothetical protein, variant 2 [Capsaspora owczarzaki ATCC 30864]|uniref:Uncharacterized protein n=2 Tax=Capsaspora owczarzaki (strain ATCC 30864) TaxID=595528 RepID=A0A0D2U664_CAPO3|nr:hypothetical protein, variant 2 [Capsaspora owczarzaki ATCC 30864]